MRKLPVYFLIDVSESMVGEPIELVERGIEQIVKELRTNPYALETVFLSVIAFAGKPKKVVPMIDVCNFYPPKLPVGGGTSLGVALNFLMKDMDVSVKKNTLEEKGDWKPIIFLFTDGNPTDLYENAFETWNKKYRRSANLIVISIGGNADLHIFGKITGEVLTLNKTDQVSFEKFFRWITKSIEATSMNVSDNTEALTLAPITNGYLSKIDLGKHLHPRLDENFAVILAKCQTTKRSYLIKYQKRTSPSEFDFVPMEVQDYRLVGTYPVDQTYFEMSDEILNNNTINTNSLVGFPGCPCCGNRYGFSYCSCGKIICTGEEEITTCPWCGMQAKFGFGDFSADVTRTRG